MILSFEEVYYDEVLKHKPSDKDLSEDERLMMLHFESLMKNACERVYNNVIRDIAIEIKE